MSKELFPFMTFCWNSAKIKRKWEPVREEILSAAWFAEYEGVKRGFRHCDVYHLYPNRFDVQIKEILDDGLYYQPILRSQQYQGFGHVHYPVKEINMDTFIYGVVADTRENAVKFREAGLGEVDHKLTGQLLAYDDCCIDWFLDIWLKKNCSDPMYETALETEGHEINDDGSITVSGDPKFNRLVRYFGFQVLPYFTCSFACENAEKFIDWFYGLMYEKAPDACEMLLEALNMPMTWSVNNLILYIEHPLFRGAANGYDWPEKRVVHWRPQ